MSRKTFSFTFTYNRSEMVQGGNLSTRNPFGRDTVDRENPFNRLNTTDFGQLVGMDNRRGKPVISTHMGRFHTVWDYEGSNEPFRNISLQKTSGSSRKMSGSEGSRKTFQGRKSMTFTGSPIQDVAETDGCIPPGSGPEPPPPDPPEPEPIPPEPEPDPDNPEPEPEPEPEDPDQPDGCDPQSRAQWYPRSSPDASGCPPSTIFRGFFERGDGSFLILCEGEYRPDSSECPKNKWSCQNGKCVQVREGNFETFEECQSSGCGKPRFTCSDGVCVESPNGQYLTREECEASDCIPRRYECQSGTCVENPEGPFMSLAECQSECSPRYICQDGNCIEDPNGNFLSLEECQNSCSSSQLFMWRLSYTESQTMEQVSVISTFQPFGGWIEVSNSCQQSENRSRTFSYTFTGSLNSGSFGSVGRACDGTPGFPTVSIENLGPWNPD